MLLTLKMAFTFMRRKNSRLPSFTTIFSVIGIAVGVASFLVVVTIFKSFEHELKQLLSAANPNLIVYNLSTGIPHIESVMEDLQKQIKSPIKKIAPFEYTEAILYQEARTAPVIIRGIQGENSANGEDLQAVILPKGALATLNAPHKIPQIILGRGLALKLGCKVGDQVSLAFNGFSGTENRFETMIVSGTMSLGLELYDERLALINFSDASRLFGTEGSARGIEVQFENPDHALIESRQLASNSPYNVRALQEINSGLFEQVERDAVSVNMIVLIITFVAGFNIIATLSLGVVDRSRQIALLRSLGANRRFILNLFITVGLLLGIVGGLFGILLGTVILKIFAGFSLGDLQQFYFLEKIPVDFDSQLFLSAFLVALVLSFASSLYPALKATRISPLFGLKRGV